MDTASLVISELALFAWREGERLAPGSTEAKDAIAFIISNRVKAGWQGGDWLKVIENTPVHSCSEEKDMLTMKMPDPWAQDWRTLLRNCQDIYEGIKIDDLTWTPSMAAIAENCPGGDNKLNASRPSFFYANLQMPIREWFMNKIIRQPADHPRTVTVTPLQLFG